MHFILKLFISSILFFSSMAFATMDIQTILQEADYGHAQAQFYLADAYEKGQDIEQDQQKALYWYSIAAEQGHIDAQYQLGNLYERTGNQEKAIYWYTKVAEVAPPLLQNHLAEMYAKNQNYDKANYWFTKVAKRYPYGYINEDGSAIAQAQYNLGFAYETGLGVEKNIDKAKEFYLQSIKYYNADAWYRLALMSENEQDLKQAIAYYENAARHGCLFAQHQLALYNCQHQAPIHNYFNQNDTFNWFVQNDQEVAQILVCYAWLSIAAQQGHPESLAIQTEIFGKTITPEFKKDADNLTQHILSDYIVDKYKYHGLNKD